MYYNRIIITLFLIALSVSPASAHTLPLGFKGFDDPKSCQPCHKTIFNEWSSSMHAKSSKAIDPLHAAMHNTFTKAMTAAGKPVNYFCGTCHTPTADNLGKLMSGEVALDPANQTNARGITCSFCHQAAGLSEGKMFNTYKITTSIQGPDKDETEAPHPTTYSDMMSFKMCLGCHGKLENAKGTVICSVDQEGYSDCLGCHMKQKVGRPAEGGLEKNHASHLMAGGHDDVMLRESAKLTLGNELGKLLIFVKNKNPHFFPSTNPLRIAYLKVEIMDESGATIFTNFVKDPSEDPKAVFVKVFKAGDKVGVPTWEAEGVARDSRLASNEERSIAYDLPKGAKKAKATLYYRLIPPAMIEKLGVKPDGVIEKARVVAEAELVIK